MACGGLKPDLCQGGCQAIEDGVVLANCLEVERDVVTALKLYETRRVKRANSIGQIAGLMGRVVQWKNPLASGARNAILKRVPINLLLHLPLWILDYEA